MIIEQALRKISSRGGKARVYLESLKLVALGLTPGSAFRTEVDVVKKSIMLLPSLIGNMVTIRHRRGKTIPVIDKSGSDIRTALEGCVAIKVTFYKDETGSRVLIEGVPTTAEVVRTKQNDAQNKLSSITFCAGAGISSMCAVDVGFKEVAGIEYNPKVGAEDRFAEIYRINHPDSILFSVPIEDLDANNLPDASIWVATLDCTDYSLLASSKKSSQFETKDLYLHLASLFKQRAKDKRPEAILIENVPGFAREAGSTLGVFFRKMGYSVTDGMLNSLDFGSRSERKRYFFVACAYEGFNLPEGKDRKETPIIEDGIITLDNLDWVTPETDRTLKYYVTRNDTITHNHKITSIDITKDVRIGTITKSHQSKKAENIIRHPFEKNTFAFLTNVGHLRYLHGIREDIYLGDSRAMQIQSIGQGVCVKTFTAIMKKLHGFLSEKMFCYKPCAIVQTKMISDLLDEYVEEIEQYCFGF